jgi:hypothetical protein
MKKEFWIPSLLHFFVDFFSIYALCSFKSWGFDPEIFAILSIAYDGLAFLPQPLFGALLERSRRLPYWGAIGCLAVVLGALIPQPVVAIILVGLGNSLFHVCLGKVILDKAEVSSPLGVFISFGSVGVGLALSFSNLYLFLSLLVVFVALTVASCFIDYSRIDYSYSVPKEQSKTKILPLVLIVLGVFLRGFFGPYVHYSFASDVSYVALWLSLAIFAGKACGGFILDVLGVLPLLLVSLTLSLVGVFFPESLGMSLLSVFGVNLLMALTMDLMRRAMPSYRAFGFGLLACFLVLGYLGGASLVLAAPFQDWLTPVLMIVNTVSLVFVGLSLRKENRLKTLLLPKGGHV